MRQIAKRFGATKALDGVDLQVWPGEVLALVGENGAGKSTLMKVISGAHHSDQGQMWINGQPYLPSNPLEARQAGVAMIYQELSLAPHLTVEENIALGLEPARFGFIQQREVRSLALKSLQLFNHPDIDPGKITGHLSVAAQQLVEIARALAYGCKILVLDEPTSCLTHRDTQMLFEQIKRLRAQGLAIIYISHFLEEVKQIADRIIVLRDGKTVGEGASMPLTEIITLMVGREVKDLYPRSPRKTGEVVLQVDHLTGQSKPQDASLTLRRGEVVGIAGLMGAGRTEFVRCLFGLDNVRRGQIAIGRYSGTASPAARWRQGVGFLSEDRKQEGLAPSLSIADNVTLSFLDNLGPWGLISPRRQAQAANRWIQALGIRCQSPEQKVINLSGGNQQKVALSRLLHHQVDILILDEPTRGIDVAAKASIYQLIDQLASGVAEHGGSPKAILIISSYLPELLGICDRIGVMCRGQLSEFRDASQWDEHSLMLAATGQDLPQKSGAEN